MQCLASLVAVVLAVVVAASLPTTASAASFGEDLAVVRGGREAAVGDVVAAAAPALDDDDARKRKRNETVAEEVLTAIVDGITGESPDAKFGSEIREQIVTLVEAVVKFGAAAATEIASENGGGSGGSSRTASDCADDADDGKECATRATRRARAVDNVGEGRRRQVRRLLVRYLVLLKVFALGIILPGAVLLSLLQSWKAVTLSLMALLLAGVIGLRGLVATAAKGQTAEVIHTTAPGGHYWKRVSGPDAEPDRLAYGAYVPVS